MTILDEWPGFNERCKCGMYNLPKGHARGIDGVIHRTEDECGPGGQSIVARYRGSEYGTGFIKDQTYSLIVINHSVFMTHGPYWHTYDSLEKFLKAWEVDTQV